MDASAPAAAPAPAAQPSAAPAPAARSTPNPSSGGRETPNLNNAFSDLDKLLSPDKIEDKGEEKNSEEPELKQDESEKKQDKVEDKTSDQPKKPEKVATLRESYEKTKSELAQVQAKLKEYEDKSKSAPKISDDDKKSYEDRVTAAEKRRAELEEHIKYVDYTKSSEYKDTYEKPFINAYSEGRKLATSLKISDSSTGEMRNATNEDFDSIMAIKETDEAATRIEELFGTGVKAQMVAQARAEVMKAYTAKVNAVEQFKTKGAEFERNRSEQMTKMNAEVAKIWKDTATEGAERLPLMFKPTEGDDKGNAALEQGYMLADLAFNAVDPANVSKLPKWVQERMVDGKLPPQEMAKLHAAIRNKAGAFDRLAYQNKQLQTQLAELKKQLGNYKSSEPGEGEKGRTKKSASDSITDVFSSIDRMASRR